MKTNHTIRTTAMLLLAVMTTSCYNSFERTNINNSKTIAKLNDYNKALFSSKEIAFNDKESIVNNSRTGDSDNEHKEQKKERFITVAFADLLGARKGLSDSKYLPPLGPHSDIIIKGSVSLIYATLFSLDAYYDNYPEDSEDNSTRTTNNTFYMGRLNDPHTLLIGNSLLDPVDVTETTDSLNNSVNLPQTFKPLMEIGARHNLLIQKIINNNLGDIEDIAPSLNSVEYQLLTSVEFNNLYSNQVNYLSSTSITMDNVVCPPDDNTLVDEVFTLFIEAFTQYPETIEDVNSIVNEYIANIELFNELTDDEKQYIYTAFCVAFASASYWDNHYE